MKPTRFEREDSQNNPAKFSKSWRRSMRFCEACAPVAVDMRRDMAYLEERIGKLQPECDALRERVRRLDELLFLERRGQRGSRSHDDG